MVDDSFSGLAVTLLIILLKGLLKVVSLILCRIISAAGFISEQ